MNTAMKAALAYTNAGLSVIPIRSDGTKALALRAGEREQYEKRIATETELKQWFVKCNLGIGILGGKVSGNLECIDFDRHADELFPKFVEIVQAENPSLLDRLVVNQTPRPGYHIVYRVDGTVSGSQRLASEPWLNPETQREERIVMIETRGEGGYFIAPGSPLAAHENKLPYKHCRGLKLSKVQTITQAEREMMLAYARSFDRIASEYQSKALPASNGKRPGDDFNERGPDWGVLLDSHGWIVQHTRGNARYWRRPGKAGDGVSATTGVCVGKDGKTDLFHVFSTNAHPFGAEKSYDKFNVYALLHHAGDFSAAAKKLAEDGYGEQRAKPDPLAIIANEIRRDAARLKPANRKEYLEALEEIGVRVIKGIDLIETK